jgi:hypothetical protein
MRIAYYIFLLIATLGSCQKMKVNNTNTSCIQSYIDSNKSNLDWPVSAVDEYEFQGRLVYALSPPGNWADATTLIRSSDCKDLCNLGGFAGRRNSNCNGDNFFEKAVLKRRVWERGK